VNHSVFFPSTKQCARRSSHLFVASRAATTLATQARLTADSLSIMATTAATSIANHNDIDHARESVELFYRINTILDAGLDRSSIALLLSLCETGANPEAIVAIFRELQAIKAQVAAT